MALQWRRGRSVAEDRARAETVSDARYSLTWAAVDPGGATAPPKASVQTELVLGSMEAFETWVMQTLEVLSGLGDKIGRIDELFTRIEELDQKFNTQVERIDVIQSNVNLTMKSIGEVRQD